MADTAPLESPVPSGSDRDLSRARRAVERGWLTQPQIDAALAAREKAPQTPLLDLLPLSEEQRRDLESGAGRPPPPDVAEAMRTPANRVGRYWLLQHLGEGGMGSVYRAWDPDFERYVALKFMKAVGDETAREYFRREARLAASLSHPNIAAMYDIGEHQGAPYIAMQFVDGPNLHRARRSLSRDQAVRAMRDVAIAVHYAHERGIVHRDLKPANLMADRDGHVFVMDFGLAKQTSLPGASLGLTRSSTILGTPEYMPPEQARGNTKEVDALSDVYSLGACLYELLGGRPPFAGEAQGDVLSRVINDEPVRLRQLVPAVPAPLETITMKCLEKDKLLRYGSAKEVADDLDRFVREEPIRGGQSLDEILHANGRLSAARAVDVMKQILRILGEAHARGVIHRCLSPATIVLEGERVRVTGFGRADEKSPLHPYASPEQAAGDPIDLRTDLYAATAILYEMLCGRRPHAADTNVRLMRAILSDTAEPVPADCAPAEVRALIVRGLDKDRERRPPNAAAYIEELERAARTVTRAAPVAPAPPPVTAGAVALWPLVLMFVCFGVAFAMAVAASMLRESPLADAAAVLDIPMVALSVVGLGLAMMAGWRAASVEPAEESHRRWIELGLALDAVALAFRAPVATFELGPLERSEGLPLLTVAVAAWSLGHVFVAAARAEARRRRAGTPWPIPSMLGWIAFAAVLGLFVFAAMPRAPRGQYGASMWRDLMKCGAMCAAVLSPAAVAFAVDARRRTDGGMWLSALTVTLLSAAAPWALRRIGWTWPEDYDGAILCAGLLLLALLSGLVIVQTRRSEGADSVALAGLAAGVLALMGASGARANIVRTHVGTGVWVLVGVLAVSAATLSIAGALHARRRGKRWRSNAAATLALSCVSVAWLFLQAR